MPVSNSSPASPFPEVLPSAPSSLVVTMPPLSLGNTFLEAADLSFGFAFSSQYPVESNIRKDLACEKEIHVISNGSKGGFVPQAKVLYPSLCWPNDSELKFSNGLGNPFHFGLLRPPTGMIAAPIANPGCRTLFQTMSQVGRANKEEFVFQVRKLQRACLRNPVKIEAASKYSTVDTLKQEYCFIPAKYKDYIHRVGRTARAGRSGVAISLVNQYELEWYIQIEKLIGKKLPQFSAQEEEVLMLFDIRVAEAKRISIMKIKESGGKKRRRGGGDDDDTRRQRR
ncbi:DEAD-box ATP-dependent RNA helicase 10, partial [Cucurbita argyrosperma subsp. sororia]